MSEEHYIAYFGFGSLVNIDTLRTPYISAHRARLKGWERVWLQRPAVEEDFSTSENIALLSVQDASHQWIDGLVVIDRRSSLPALDAREVCYDRLELAHSDVTFLDDNPFEQGDLKGKHTPLYIYKAQMAPKDICDGRILRSYLDAVMQGFHRQFGARGLQDFVATTARFDTPILEDRENPIYPRHVVLTADEKKLIDRLKPFYDASL